MGNCVRGVHAGKVREANQQPYKTNSQVNSKIPQPAETLVSLDIPACDNEIFDSCLLDNEEPYISQEGGTDCSMMLSKSQEHCITKNIPQMTSESIEQDKVLLNDFDHALEYHSCQTCPLLQERIQMLLNQNRSREEKTHFSDHVTCTGIHDSLICGTSSLLPLHEDLPSTTVDNRFEKKAYFHQNSQDENCEGHEDRESELYKVQEGPGTNWQFGNHYFNETHEDEASKDDNANTRDFFPDASLWKLPINDFLSIGGKGISVEALGCEVTLGPQIGLSIFGNRIL
ncbi:uncharacterized protein LOC125031208 [Penaeus chinensis]|uniref:uncharacterized protein LOC125031208 n=1 Tax=Penaeus chinensis TaxID=139456 RepID=UPI001FB5A0E7|nr:uncharacterized protein LOC125031208 [Penaeus chinensis]